MSSNYIGAKNFLEVIYNKKLNIKFFKANSGYIFNNDNKKIKLDSRLAKPNNPYVSAQVKAYKLIKYYRKLGLPCYSLIFFNIESALRSKDFFIQKICDAVKYKKRIEVGNIFNIRDFAWASEIMRAVSLLHKIKPCDIILASGKGMSGKQIIKYLFQLKNLDFKKYINVKKNLFRKNEKKIIVSSMTETLRKLKKFNWKPIIFGKKLVYKMYNNL